MSAALTETAPRPRRARPLAALAAAAALVLAAAATSCITTQVVETPPLLAPRCELTVRHFVGSPVSGPVAVLMSARAPTAAADPGPPENALQAVATFVALEALPEHPLGPLGPRTRLLVSDEGSDPIRPAARLLGGARIGLVPDARSFTADVLRGGVGRAARIGELRGVIPPGVTCAFELERRTEQMPLTVSPTAGQGGRLRLSIRRIVSGEDDKGALFEVAIGVQREGEAARPGLPRRELVVADPWPLRARNDFAVIAPVTLAGEETHAIAVICSVLPPPSAEGVDAARHRAALAQCRADLARDAAIAREPPELKPIAGLPRPDLERARRALYNPTTQRTALFAIAQGTGARLAEDVALSGDGPLVATVCAAVAASIVSGPPVRGPMPGWPVERAAIQGVLKLSRATEDIVVPDLFLLRRLGAVVWAEEILDASLKSATDIPDFDQRVIAANRGLLDDGQPSVRARAYEWLDARGLAPDGYDPLADTQQRRGALEKAGIATAGGSP